MLFLNQNIMSKVLIVLNVILRVTFSFFQSKIPVPQSLRTRFQSKIYLRVNILQWFKSSEQILCEVNISIKIIPLFQINVLQPGFHKFFASFHVIVLNGTFLYVQALPDVAEIPRLDKG